MEEKIDLSHHPVWKPGDKALLGDTFLAAVAFETSILEWAFSRGYLSVIREDKRGRPIHPNFSGALGYLKSGGHVPESLGTLIKKAWDTRNNLMHNFAWRAALLGPSQTTKDVLYEARKALTIAQHAVIDAWKPSNP
jgi:hypothetical protein